MEQLSIILLCVFIPVIVLLILCLLCVSIYWKKKWKSRNKSFHIEAHKDTRSRNKSRENEENIIRFQDEVHSKDKHEETQIPLMVLRENDGTQRNTNQQYFIENIAAEKEEQLRTKTSICTKEIALQTTLPETSEKYTQILYAAENKCTQTEEPRRIQQGVGLDTPHKSERQGKKRKKKSKSKKTATEGLQDDAKQSVVNEVETINLIEFDPPKGNKNLGNTCFFNSTLQALYFTKSFKDALSCMKKSLSSIDTSTLTERVLDLLEKKNTNHSQELTDVLNTVRNINDQFGRGTQEDSYELLNTLLGGLFDELRTVSENGTLQSADYDSDQNGISVKNLFTGFFITIYVYDSCCDVEVDFEEFTTLSIPIIEELERNFDKLPHHGLQTISSEEPQNDIEKGLADLIQIEDYDESSLSCRICNIEGSGKAYRRMLVFQPPPVLVIHINRFKMNDFNNLTKDTTCVRYPRRFNMAKFCSVANTELSTKDLNYELYAVIVHSGALWGGHYYAYVNTTRKHDVKKWQEHLNRSTGDLEELKTRVEDLLREKRDQQDDSGYLDRCNVRDNWFYVSDDYVRSANAGEALCHKDAYILFYEVQ